jgi:MFS family permease
MESNHQSKMEQNAQNSNVYPKLDTELQPLTPPTTPPPVTKPDLTKRHTSAGDPHVSSTSPPESPPLQEADLDQRAYKEISKLKSVSVIATLAGISFLNTMGSGILISALPRIADDIGLSEGFLLWPASVYALAAGCLLLIFGAVADVVGAKIVWVTGSFFYMIFTVAVGLSRTGVQIILFRTFMGASIAMCLPTAVSLITNTFPKGTWRNVGFASNGIGQPLGFSVGLILGGVFTDTIGWRWSFYVMAIINSVISISAIWILPNIRTPSEKSWRRRLIEDIDWVGACIMSAALGILLYVLATTTSSYHKFSDPTNIALLAVSLVLLAVFPMWMSYQVRHGKPAIIPNRLWRNAAFTATCIAVFFCWASLNAIEYYTTL